jgi:hypothetical protein
MDDLAARADDALAAAKAVVAGLGGRDRAVAALRQRIWSILQDQDAPLAPASRPQARDAHRN